MAKWSAIIPMRQLILWAVIASLMYPMVASESEPNDDFSSATPLAPPNAVDGTVSGEDDDDPEDYYQIAIEMGDTIEFTFTSADYVDFCIYKGKNNRVQEKCYMVDSTVTHYVKDPQHPPGYIVTYYVGVSCGECSISSDTIGSYRIQAIIHPDEAGDSLDDAAELSPEVRIEGWAALDEDAEPLDFDYYRTPVMEGDTIRVVINSDADDMTSYRIYDRYGIKTGEDYEMGDYDLNINVDYTGDLFIEIFCTQNYGEPCDYSLIAIGSTYDPGHAAGIPESSQYVPLPIIIAVAVFIVLVIALIVNSSRRNNTAIDGQTTISNTAPSEHHITSPQPLIDPAPIVQPTHSDTTVSTLMQDSVHQGDIVGGDKFDTKVVNDPEAIARAAIKGYEMGMSSDGDESD